MPIIDLSEKKKFLLDVSLLCEDILKQIENDCLRRFFAFRIIVNAMAFEEIIKGRNNTSFPHFQAVRDVFLAHKQDGNFWSGFDILNTITNTNIQKLLNFMKSEVVDDNSSPGRLNPDTLNQLKLLAKRVLKKFDEDFFSGVRMSNNFLCSGKKQISEMSSGPIASIFYRYNSSKELSILANYFI